MSLYLGIDMGGTASRWVVCGPDGAVAARGDAPGATGHLFNPEARAAFMAAIDAIARACAAHRPIAAVHAGVTGLGPRAAGDAHAIIAEALACPTEAVTSSDDMELAFRAAFAPGEGHLVSAGTGSVGLHIAADGTVIRVGGRGILIDDGGSGSWIVLRALDAIYREIDETGGTERTEILARHLFAAMGGDSWDDTRAYIYGGDRGRIGALARTVAAAAEDGDPLARDLLSRAGRELARMGAALARRGGALPVGFVGGVLSLHPLVPTAIHAALPGIAVRFPRIDATFAAAHIARDRAQTTGSSR